MRQEGRCGYSLYSFQVYALHVTLLISCVIGSFWVWGYFYVCALHVIISRLYTNGFFLQVGLCMRSSFRISTMSNTSDSTSTVGLKVSQLASGDDGFQVVVRRDRKRGTPEDGRGSGGTPTSSPKVMLQSSTKNIIII